MCLINTVDAHVRSPEACVARINIEVGCYDQSSLQVLWIAQLGTSDKRRATEVHPGLSRAIDCSSTARRELKMLNMQLV